MRTTALQMVASRLWLIEPTMLETILAIADRQGDPQALAEKLGRPLDNAHTVEVRDGVAIIPVTGPIFRYANLFTDISGATSTQILATDFRQALDNPSVKSILWNFDTPGGEANGIHELGQMIYSARGKKPMASYVGNQAASAGYWLSSAVGRTVIDRTAALGSIGVVVEVRDSAERDARNGMKTYTIVSNVSPKKRPDFSTEEGRSELQQRVDSLANIFVETVARNRGVSVDAVLANFGQGGVKTGQAAIDSGMADQFGSLESVLAELAGPASKSIGRFAMSTKSTGPVVVSDTAQLHAALEAGHTAKDITIQQPDLDAIRAEAHAAGKTEGLSEQACKIEAATKAERERVIAIQGIAVAGFEKEISEAISSGASVESTSLTILKATKDRGITLDGMQRDSTATSRANAAQAVTSGWDKAVGKVSKKK